MPGGVARTCRECDRPLCSENRSGLCSPCVNRSPEHRARVSRGLKRTYALNPVKLEACRARMRANRASPKATAARRERLQRIKMWIAGNAAQPKGSPSRLLAAARANATKLAWCPPHLRGDYLFLTKKKRIKAAEARRIIEDQHEMDMARWRREIGLAADPPISGPVHERIVQAVARVSGVSEAELRSGDRQRRVSVPRFAAMICMRDAGMVLADIGLALGSRDHSTISYGLKHAGDEDVAAIIGKARHLAGVERRAA